MKIGDPTPQKERLCGSGSAHRACQFAGDRSEKPPKLACKAEDGPYAGCRYADTHGNWHRFWRSELDRKGAS